MPTTNDLMQNVYAHFLGAYPGAAAAKEVVLAFEPLGLLPGIDMTAPGPGAVALEFISSAANVIPDLSDGNFMPTERSVSGVYQILLGGAQPNDPSNTSAFNMLKASAQEAMHNGASGSLLGAYSYYPAFASPSNWYDPTATDNWTSYVYSAGDPNPQSPAGATPSTPPTPTATPSTPTATPTTPSLRVVNTIRMMPAWRLTAEAPNPQPRPASGPTSGTGPSLAAKSTLSQGRFRSAATSVAERPYFARAEMLHLAPAAASGVQKPPVAEQAAMWLRPMVMRAPLPSPTPQGAGQPAPGAPPPKPLVSGNDGPTPSLEPYFKLTFDYCVIQLRRPWMSGDLLMTGGWYVQGARAGDYAAGPQRGQQGASSNPPAPGDGAPLAAQVGAFSWLPVACIAIRNLVIQARGGTIDASTASAATAFGPFRCLPSAAADDSLRNPGIQIIAWICEAQPQLPPATDPVISPPSATQTADEQTTEAAAEAASG
jgi:hypothetical protein